VRQQQGLALDVLANQIFIRPALLQALESGQGTELPEPVFIHGFIRRYAEALGLDGQAIAREFQVTAVDVLPSPEAIAQADTNGVVEPEVRHSVRVLEKVTPAPTVRSPRRSLLPLALSLGALAAILAVGAWGLLGRSNAPSVANTVPEPAPAPAASEPPAEELPLATEETTAAEPTETLEAPVVVSANLSDRAWLSVVADGEKVYEGVAESGFEETWTAQEQVVFTTGNAGGVALSVNGDRPVTVGDSGDVRTLTLTTDSSLDTVQLP
jgi:cytoskeletal protein RodZ